MGFGNSGQSLLVRNLGPQWKYVRVTTLAFSLIIYLLHFEVNYICLDVCVTARHFSTTI